jgi:putative methionine-R-sulfoxide reductase with GAF domain
MLDLYEVLDISEMGVAVQCPSPVKAGQEVELCLDLAEARAQILTKARVVWSDSNGRAGLGFVPLPEVEQRRLREWLFLNAMAGAANAASGASLPSFENSIPRLNYTDALSAASAVQREAESLGADVEAVLALVASRSQSLLRASGAAIALAGKDAATMICRACAGPGAPPVGAALQVGSGFSGECVLTAKLLRCDDTETDERVDRQSCRALGIRSILAAPVRSGEKVVGLLEVFSARPNAFGENDSAVLQRFAETILAAINRSARVDRPSPPPVPPQPFVAAPGSVLFAHAPEERSDEKNSTIQENRGGIRLPRAQLYLLMMAAVTIALALGFVLAPWIQPWMQDKLQFRRVEAQTVMASSKPPGEPSPSAPSAVPNSVDFATLEQLLAAGGEQSLEGNSAAENAMGLLYAQGDEKQDIKQNETEASRWFTKAAEHGSLAAQYKLGLLYWGGHGVPKDPNKAYFWAVLARAGGQEGSKDLAKVLATGMTRAQATAIEQQAEMWYQQHEAKPHPGH